MAPQDPQIKVVPVVPADYVALSRVEDIVFADNDFGEVAFGPDRRTDVHLDRRAATLAAPPKSGDTIRDIKAVRVGPTGEEEIVGFAGWTICVGRTGSEREKKKLGTKEAWAQENPPGDEPFGPGANVKFCTDAFVKADQHMARSTGGNDYASELLLL
jgi:hypothetical protein